MTRADLRFRALVDAGLHSGDCDGCGEPMGDEVIQGVSGYYCTVGCRNEMEDDCFRQGEDDDDDAYVDLDFLPA